MCDRTDLDRQTYTDRQTDIADLSIPWLLLRAPSVPRRLGPGKRPWSAIYATFGDTVRVELTFPEIATELLTDFLSPVVNMTGFVQTVRIIMKLPCHLVSVIQLL